MVYRFGECTLDTQRHRLQRGGQPVRLRAKAFQVLCYLLEHRDRTVLKSELYAQVWPQSFISEATLESTLRAVRQAIGDSGRAQQLIQTVYGYGYRFIAAVEVCADMPLHAAGETPRSHPGSAPAPPPDDDFIATPVRLMLEAAGQRVIAPVAAAKPYAGRHQAAGTSRLTQRATSARAALFVGRENELARLHQWFTTALQGQRQVGFVTGTAGIGKTALVETFIAQVSATEALWVGHGQCLAQYGPGEPYLPVLEALGRLCRGAEGAPFLAYLRQYAPSWLAQMAALLSPADWETLQRTAGGATQQRMLRELTEALDRLTAERPLVLVLEDLQWSDVSTLEWLTYVARRRDPARLLILGTYRPGDAMVRPHPVHAVMTELTQHQQATELPLDYLSEADVAAYCRQRLRAQGPPDALAQVLHQRTLGHPLFLGAIVDELIRQALLHEGSVGRDVSQAIEAIRGAVPESLRQIIEQQLQQLSPEDLGLLEVASLAGREFSAAAVAAAVNRDMEDIEARLAVLAHQGLFIRSAGLVEWPDGTEAAGYSFLHDLYPEILSERVPPSRKRRWHLQIGARKETGYGARAREIAAELAGHFVQGRDPRRAVQHLQYAGENALQRSAHREAIAHFTQALTLLPMLSATAKRTTQELQVQMALGPALMATKGFADPDVARTYRRARELCQQLEETPDLFPALWGLWQFANGSAQIQAARELGTQLLTVARQSHDPVLLVQAHHTLWSTELNAGALTAAYAHTEHGLRLYTPGQHSAHRVHYGVDDPGVCCGITAAQLLWLLGYPDQAIQRSNEALALAQELGHPFSLAYALADSASLHRLRRDVPSAQAWGEAAMALGTAHGFSYVLAWGPILRGWILVMQGRSAEGIAQVRQGLTAWRAKGSAHLHPAYMVAEAYGKVGLIAEGLAVLAEALHLVETTGERKYEAELYRLKGELLWHAGCRPEEAEACFHHALTIARRQQAKSWELRAAVSLSRLWQRRGRREDARQLLAPIYGWFTEGFDTADLKEAKTLLEELS